MEMIARAKAKFPGKSHDRPVATGRSGKWSHGFRYNKTCNNEYNSTIINLILQL